MKQAAALFAAGLLTASHSALAQTRYGTVHLNNYDSGKGLFEPKGLGAASPGTAVEVWGGPDAALLTPVASIGTGSTYIIQPRDVNVKGPNTGSFFDYGQGVVNGVPPNSTATLQLRVWQGAGTFDQATIRSSITWTQVVGSNPVPPNFPVPAILEIPAPLVLGQASPPSLLAPLRSQTAAAGATVSFNVNATGTLPLSYYWQKDGVTLPGAATAQLTLSNVSRADAGTYTVFVFDATGGHLTNEATLRVMVPQQFQVPTPFPNGRVQLRFRDADGNVATHAYAANYFEVQASTNLTLWQAVSGSLSLTNSFLVFEESTPLNSRDQFYRIIER